MLSSLYGKAYEIKMKRFVAIFFFIFSPLSVHAESLPSDVKRALEAIPTITGQSVLKRMKSCRMTFSDGAWIEKQTVANSQIGSLVGDSILEVYFNVPPMPGDNRPEARVVYNDLLARWIIRNGKAMPISGWANTLQQSPIPMRSVQWLNC